MVHSVIFGLGLGKRYVDREGTMKGTKTWCCCLPSLAPSAFSFLPHNVSCRLKAVF